MSVRAATGRKRVGRCPYCAGTGEAFDPQTGEGPRCPACKGTGVEPTAVDERADRIAKAQSEVTALLDRAKPDGRPMGEKPIEARRDEIEALAWPIGTAAEFAMQHGWARAQFVNLAQALWNREAGKALDDGIKSACPCYACLDDPSLGLRNPVLQRMVLCPTCGNKRCPHAANHLDHCSGSNEPGQVPVRTVPLTADFLARLSADPDDENRPITDEEATVLERAIALESPDLVERNYADSLNALHDAVKVLLRARR